MKANSLQNSFFTMFREVSEYKPRNVTRIMQVIEPAPMPVSFAKSPKSLLIAEALRKAAQAMDKQIQAKIDPPISYQNPTRRRSHIAENMREEGRRLQEVQAKLMALADGHECETLPTILSGIRYRAQVEVLLRPLYFKWDYGYKNLSHKETISLAKAGIMEKSWPNALEAFNDLEGAAKENEAIKNVRLLEAQLLGVKIPGYVPTPKKLAERLVHYAELADGDRVLEPSAGKGNIAEALQYGGFDIQLEVVEHNRSLREILSLKGFNVVGEDIFQHTGQYDKIVMNPPFENFQDIDHVRHCYDNLLAPGGRLVAIMCASTFFRDTKKAKGFEDWLSNVRYLNKLTNALEYSNIYDNNIYLLEKLPADAFKESGTGVQAYLVVIDKE